MGLRFGVERLAGCRLAANWNKASEVQSLAGLFARAEAALDTILPRLFLMRLSLVRPVYVFTLVPLKTEALALLPLAITLTLFAFMTFMPFMAALAFIAFMATAFFMGSAIAIKRRPRKGSVAACTGNLSHALHG